MVHGGLVTRHLGRSSLIASNTCSGFLDSQIQLLAGVAATDIKCRSSSTPQISSGFGGPRNTEYFHNVDATTFTTVLHGMHSIAGPQRSRGPFRCWKPFQTPQYLANQLQNQGLFQHEGAVLAFLGLQRGPARGCVSFRKTLNQVPGMPGRQRKITTVASSQRYLAQRANIVKGALLKY